MDLITPLDFIAMFPEQRELAVVGNAPSLVGARLGTWIDAHDVVVRFNEAALSGHEADVGERTDILVTNPYTEARVRPPLDGSRCRVVLVISPVTRRGDLSVFSQWIGDNKVLFTYTPDPGHLQTLRSGGLTTGVAAYAMLRRLLNPASIGLTGFTMFLEDTAHSYWSAATPPGVEKHDMRSNAATLIELVNASVRSQVTVTSEIAWMARRVGAQLSKKVAIKRLPDPKWETD